MSDETIDAFLTFVLGDVAYAVDVCFVREVLTYETITRVPRTAPYLKGVLNIRGTVIPVIDLRILFNITPQSIDEESSIIVSEIALPDESELIFGFIADAVENVKHINVVSATVDGAQTLDMIHNDFIKQVGTDGERFVLILDMEKIIEYIEENLATKAQI
ncbi:MAG: purine-binding chemotaxis protein CheW [Treponema sp.]|jgi:purine-binding chemotaxis protein CheW|nr:purine-binding chemotaxis protein CheW [Treponema sp.]